MSPLLVAYLMLPTLGVVALGLLWTWRLAFERPQRRTVAGLTVAALALAALYPLPIAWLAWRAQERSRMPYELVVPTGYSGPMLLVACADAGPEAAGDRIVVPANGIARVRHAPDDLAGRTEVRVRDAGGEERVAIPYMTDLPGGGCGWFEINVLPGPGDPYTVPFSQEDLRSREARAVAEGRTFADVSADPVPPPGDTDAP